MLAWRNNPDRVYSAGVSIDPRSWSTHHLGVTDTVRSWRGRGAQRVDSLDGAAVLIKREAMESTGQFNESYFMYFEEADYFVRMRRHGWASPACPRRSRFSSLGSIRMRCGCAIACDFALTMHRDGSSSAKCCAPSTCGGGSRAWATQGSPRRIGGLSASSRADRRLRWPAAMGPGCPDPLRGGSTKATEAFVIATPLFVGVEVLGIVRLVHQL